MDPIYAETIHSFSEDLDNLWKDKNAYNSVKSSEGVSIEDGNFCSYNRFMLSSARGTADDVSLSSRTSRYGPTGWATPGSESMSVIDRLAKTATIWTLPDVTRPQADKILHNFEPGIFIVRMTTDKKTMVLSYRMTERTQHVMIKVNQMKGFYMDGSQHIFRNVNHMIAHYMKHPVHSPDLTLKLPRALKEAHEAAHFQFFENMKINFWTTLLATKSIDDIWSKPIHDGRTKEKHCVEDKELCPPLPPRGYNFKELNLIQGLADGICDEYQEIQKRSRINLPPPPPKSPPIIEGENIEKEKNEEEKNDNEDDKKAKEERVYSQIWKWDTVGNKVETIDQKGDDQSSKCSTSFKKSDAQPVSMMSTKTVNLQSKRRVKNTESSESEVCYTIPNIIKRYYPQLIYEEVELNEKGSAYPSLQENILKKGPDIFEGILKPTKNEILVAEKKPEEQIYTGTYETPWDLKNTWISKLMDMENRDVESQDHLMTEFMKVGSSGSCLSLPQLPGRASPESGTTKKRMDSIDSTDTENEEELQEDENRLQVEFLKDIETVMFSPSQSSEIYATYKSQFGKSIRDFLVKLCSRRGTSDIAKSVQLFISCTKERNDLSPYTTMRLIRQYMGGLKNLITKNREKFALNIVIDEEIKKTPNNVFINLDSIIESVLTKSVIKPLRVHIYKLLVLEHYKNNNLKQIAGGVEISKLTSLEKLGLQENIKSIIDSKLESIQQKFGLISKQYSPEKKIKYMISIVDVVFNMLKSIYPKTEVESMQIDIKSDKILPLFVYIFSQCKIDAMATQCEVEFVEGLIWSSKLVNGEPGFFLLNLMSALEAIKVLSRPSLQDMEPIDINDVNPVKIKNSSFFTKINPSSLSSAAVGSVNVIIIDEKINRLVTKTFPIRSTVTVGSLCNTIAHRLGIFSPKDYSLYKYNGFDEFLLQDHECPLLIKQTFQQQTGESINFLFRRKNANFILPPDIPAR